MKLEIPTNREDLETDESTKIPEEFSNEGETWDFLYEEGFKPENVYSYVARVPGAGAYVRVMYRALLTLEFELYMKAWHYGNPFGSPISTSIKLTPETLNHINFLRNIAGKQ